MEQNLCCLLYVQ